MEESRLKVIHWMFNEKNDFEEDIKNVIKRLENNHIFQVDTKPTPEMLHPKLREKYDKYHAEKKKKNGICIRFENNFCILYSKHM